MRRTKTICTLGPASESPEVLEKLVLEGMDIARFNFSHATPEEYKTLKTEIESLNRKHEKDVKTLVDLQGPRMRVGKMPEEGINLREDEEVVFTTDKNTMDAIYINDPYLHEDIQIDHPLYLANGDMELVVTKIEETKIHTKVVKGGTLYSRKAVNVPETDLTTRGLTPKDVEDVAFAVQEGVDYIALSFVKDAEDMEALRRYTTNSKTKIIAKIELRLALSNLDEIIKVSDMVMVARGDLGIEVPLEELPVLQKEIIRKCNRAGKPCIVATQMLMSMVNHHRPTRAEVSDVANAVLDGADIVMLSDETSFGKYPAEALSYLVRTIDKAEEYQLSSK
jgi:pyruvate kinase